MFPTAREELRPGENGQGPRGDRLLEHSDLGGDLEGDLEGVLIADDRRRGVSLCIHILRDSFRDAAS